MKKLLSSIMACIMVLGMLTGCVGKPKVVGTWFSDEDEDSLLIINEDNSFTADGLIGVGRYTVEEDTLYLNSALGDTYILKIEKENGETVLREYDDDGTIDETYYSSRDLAKSAREAHEEQERIEKEKKAKEAETKVKKSIVGYWITEDYFPVEFTKDGEYITYEEQGIESMKYKVVSGGNIVFTDENGEEHERWARIEEDGSLTTTPDGYAQANYIKTEPLALSQDILLGGWYSPANSEKPELIFQADGTFIRKNNVWGEKWDVTENYTLEGDNSYLWSSQKHPEQEKRWGYLSKTDTEYHLFWTYDDYGYFQHMTKPIDSSTE